MSAIQVLYEVDYACLRLCIAIACTGARAVLRLVWPFGGIVQN